MCKIAKKEGMVEVKKLEYGCVDLVFGIPVLELVSDGNTVGWLSPFRGYRFQVSATKEGEHDLGATEVIGLKHVVEVEYNTTSEKRYGYQSNVGSEEIQDELLAGLASIAIAKFSTGINRAYLMPSVNLNSMFNPQFTEFIHNCRIWLNSI